MKTDRLKVLAIATVFSGTAALLAGCGGDGGTVPPVTGVVGSPNQGNVGGSPGVGTPQSPGDPPGTRTVLITGSAPGTYQIPAGLPDVGKTYAVTAAGLLQPLGSTQITGSFHTPGFIRSGNARGQLTLTNASGTMTLGLTGPTQPGFSPPPSTFQYTITAGSGAYQNAQGSGTVQLSLTPGPATGPLTGSGALNFQFTPDTSAPQTAIGINGSPNQGNFGGPTTSGSTPASGAPAPGPMPPTVPTAAGVPVAPGVPVPLNPPTTAPSDSGAPVPTPILVEPAGGQPVPVPPPPALPAGGAVSSNPAGVATTPPGAPGVNVVPPASINAVGPASPPLPVQTRERVEP